VIGLDSKAHASTCATAPLNASGFDDFAALHAKLAGAMFETFCEQLALIHTCLTTFPAAWPRSDAESVGARVVKVEPSALPAQEVAFAANVVGPEVLYARRQVRKHNTAGKKILR
jgi:hypothetical protein